MCQSRLDRNLNTLHYDGQYVTLRSREIARPHHGATTVLRSRILEQIRADVLLLWLTKYHKCMLPTIVAIHKGVYLSFLGYTGKFASLTLGQILPSFFKPSYKAHPASTFASLPPTLHTFSNGQSISVIFSP